MLFHPPMNEIVKWNPHEKVIGVVGVAPLATADFYKKLIELTPVKKDWEHVRVVIDSNPKIPSRGRYLELGETDPVPYIQQAITGLQAMGASIIAVPCNTAHILYQRYAENTNAIIPNMIDITRDAAIQQFPTAKTAVIFSSKLTQQYGLYQKTFQQREIVVLDISPHQKKISSLIEKVKQGYSLPILSKEMDELFSAYQKADIFILGCTELSTLIADNNAQVPIIDSNVALAKACLKLAQGNYEGVP